MSNHTSTRGIAALVAAYRATIAADPELHDGAFDLAYWLLTDTVGRDWSPSEVARAIGVETAEAQLVLGELAERGLIARTYRGAWSRFYAR